MVQWSRTLMLTALLALLLACCPTLAQQRRKNSKTDKAGLNTNWCMPLKKAEKKGINLDCSSPEGGGRIVHLSVVGVVDQCRGLTAHMFVEMNSCLWKEKCRLKKDKKDKYMVKLYGGSPAQCIIKPIKQFLVNYQCANAGVRVLDVMAKNTDVITERKGILRSHEHHPWLYRWKHHLQDEYLTLRKPTASPSQDALVFVYTIRTLSLMYNDVLKVTSKGRINDVTEYHDDITNKTTAVISGADEVTFQLVTSRFSTGGEGFVVCFQWVRDSQMDDACSGLVSPGKKPRGMKDCSRKRGGGKRKKGGREENRKKQREERQKERKKDKKKGRKTRRKNAPGPQLTTTEKSV